MELILLAIGIIVLLLIGLLYNKAAQKNKRRDTGEKIIDESKRIELMDQYLKIDSKIKSTEEKLDKAKKDYETSKKEIFEKDNYGLTYLKNLFYDKFEKYWDRFTFRQKDYFKMEYEVEVDFHNLKMPEVKILFPSLIKICSNFDINLIIIHGYNHGTAIKDYVREYKDKCINYVFEDAFNKGATSFEIKANEKLYKVHFENIQKFQQENFKPIKRKFETQIKKRQHEIDMLTVEIKSLEKELQQYRVSSNEINRYKIQKQEEEKAIKREKLQKKLEKEEEKRIRQIEEDKKKSKEEKQKEILELKNLMDEMGVTINLKVDKNLDLARKMKAKKVWDKDRLLPDSKSIAMEMLLMDLTPEQVEKYQGIKRKTIAFYQISRPIKTKSFCTLALLENKHIYEYLDEEMKNFVNGVRNKNSGLDYINI